MSEKTNNGNNKYLLDDPSLTPLSGLNNREFLKENDPNSYLHHPNENHIDNQIQISSIPPVFKKNSTSILKPTSRLPTSKLCTPQKDLIAIRRAAIPVNIFEIHDEKLGKYESTGLRVSSMSMFDDDNSKSAQHTCRHKIKLAMKRYLDHNMELAVMTVFTLFALFGSDLKSIGLDPSYDSVFNGFFILVMVAFFIEMFGSMWVKSGYLCSFFFWLDLFAAVSMILEIDWILQPIVDWIIVSSMGRSVNNVDLVLLSKKSQKISMTIRVLRIIRLIRIVKLYKAAIVFIRNREMKKRIEEMRSKNEQLEDKEMQKRKRAEERYSRLSRTIGNLFGLRPKATVSTKARVSVNPNILPEESKPNESPKDSSLFAKPDHEINNFLPKMRKDSRDKVNALLIMYKKKKEQEMEEEMLEETKISKLLSESITQKVIIMILLLLFLSPLTDEDAYASDSSISYVILCKYLNNIVQSYGNVSHAINETLRFYINNHTDYNYPIISIDYSDWNLYLNTSLSSTGYRVDEIAFAYAFDGETLVTYSNKANSVISAVINLSRTIFACIVLFAMAYILGQDSKTMVLNPLEVMINVVDTVSKDPVNYKTIQDLKTSIKNSIDQIKKKNKMKDVSELSIDYEIKIIQFAIIRISALMAIGFGEAGGEILRENIRSSEGLNPMLPGKRIQAIFGFCLIRRFADINEALQEKTIVFVNQIADIVHSSVDRFGGAANKNIGDSFLLVWKFIQSTLENNTNTDAILDPESRNVNYVADQAVLAFLNIIKKINKSPNIIAYRSDKLLQMKFDNKFKVQMAFGLHVGWGIEGAIGSFYKIDCSYLSPNVNLAARLETATNIYGVDILISGELFKLLSPFMKKFCRLIDIVNLKGSVTPVKLYTIDITTNLKPGNPKKKKVTVRERRNYFATKKAKLKKEYEMQIPATIGEIYLARSKGFRALMKSTKSKDFLWCFSRGLECYQEGKWEEAYTHFKDALYIDKTDGPSKTLYRFIKAMNKKAPAGWEGVRKMEAKF